MIKSPQNKSDNDYNDLMQKLEHHVTSKEKIRKSQARDKSSYKNRYEIKSEECELLQSKVKELEAKLLKYKTNYVKKSQKWFQIRENLENQLQKEMKNHKKM